MVKDFYKVAKNMYMQLVYVQKQVLLMMQLILQEKLKSSKFAFKSMETL